MIERLLLFIITSISFLIITKDFMDIYLKEKNLSVFLKTLIWGIFYIVEAIGTEYINIPICLLCFELLSSFCLSCVLYCGSVRKKILFGLYHKFVWNVNRVFCRIYIHVCGYFSVRFIKYSRLSYVKGHSIYPDNVFENFSVKIKKGN